MADVDRSLRAMRAAALATERAAQRAILAAWRSTWGTVTTLLDGLVAAATQARRRGVGLTVRWFQDQRAYRSLLAGLQSALQRFAGVVGSVVASARYAVAAAIAPIAAQAVGLASLAPLVPGVAPLALVAGLVKALPDTVTWMMSLVRGGLMTPGVGPRELTKAIRRAANTVPVRALATSRTNVHEAAREAALATYRQHPEAVGKWRWVASLGPRCCALCFARHGTLYPLTRSMDTHSGCRCLCAPEPRESTVQAESGEEVFRRLPRDVQRQILGPGKLALWESGELASLSDLVVKTQSARYGPGMREKSLRELRTQ